MIQVETKFISGSCNAWKSRLNTYRQNLAECQVILQQAVSRQLSQGQLQAVEQLHNQFHIQLINIHDLRHAIRAHLRKTDYELQAKNGHLNDDTMAEHEVLVERYEDLETHLRTLLTRFRLFLAELNN